MKNIKLIGLNHLQSGMVGAFDSGFTLVAAPFKFRNVINATSQGALGFFVNADKKIGYATGDVTGSIKASVSQIPLGQLIDDRLDVAELTIGFKAEFLLASTTAAFPYFGWQKVINTTDAQATPHRTLAMNANVKPPNGFYEFVLRPNVAGGAGMSVDMYIDSVPTFSHVIPNNYASKATLKELCLNVGSLTIIAFSTTTAGQGGALGDTMFTMENIYAQYDTVNTGTTRLGPIVVKPLPVDSDNAAPWTPSDATSIKAVLNKANHHGNVLTPYVTSDLAKTPLRIKPDVSSLDPTDVIVAIAGATSANRDAATPASLSAKWAYNSVESASNTYNMTTGDWKLQVDQSLPTLTTMPDGTPITKAKVALLEMVLTPGAAV
jgi:hypothetical protein